MSLTPFVPSFDPANGRVSSKELEKDGPGGNPLLVRNSWTSEIDQERRNAGLRIASPRFSLVRSPMSAD